MEQKISKLAKVVATAARKVKAGYSNNPDYVGDWFGEGQIDFSAIINPNDSGEVWMVKLWGGSGYILDVYLVKANDFEDAVNKVFEWSYENEGANNIVFDRENLENEALEYFKDEPDMFDDPNMDEEEFIDRFLEEYYVANEDYSLFAREDNFFADKVPEEYLKGNKESSKRVKLTKKAIKLNPVYFENNGNSKMQDELKMIDDLRKQIVEESNIREIKNLAQAIITAVDEYKRLLAEKNNKK